MAAGRKGREELKIQRKPRLPVVRKPHTTQTSLHVNVCFFDSPNQQQTTATNASLAANNK